MRVWVLPANSTKPFQTTLRSSLPEGAVVVATVTNDWQPGYLPPPASYGHGVYQEIIGAVAAGSLKALTEQVYHERRRLADGA